MEEITRKEAVKKTGKYAALIIKKVAIAIAAIYLGLYVFFYVAEATVRFASPSPKGNTIIRNDK